MSEARHTIRLPDGSRVEVTGDKYEVHLAKPIVVHRKHWIRSFLAKEEVRRTYFPSESDPIGSALEQAFRSVPQIIYGDDDDGPRHYDSNGYCDNPARGY